MKLIVVALLLLAVPAGGQPAITRTVVAAGGQGAASGTLTILSTLGQAAASVSSAGSLTLGAGFWSLAVSPTTSTSEEWVPESFLLHASAPNPAFDATTLAFDVPGQGGVLRLDIHDIHGRLVRSVVRGFQLPGRHRVRWDGRDERGALLPAGLYLVVLDAPGYRATRKLALVR